MEETREIVKAKDLVPGDLVTGCYKGEPQVMRGFLGVDRVKREWVQVVTVDNSGHWTTIVDVDGARFGGGNATKYIRGGRLQH